MSTAAFPLALTDTAGTRHELSIPPGGRTVARVLSDLGFPLNTRCGHRGLCKGCEVQLESGALELADGEEVRAPGAVRSCLARAMGPLALSIPARSGIAHRAQVSDTFETGGTCGHDPFFPVVPGVRDTGFAVDIGTTTVAVLLVDLTDGSVLAKAGGFNGQIRFGDNVLTRIECSRTPEALAAMQASVAGTISGLLGEVCSRAGRSASRLAGGTLAGNTTMLHFVAGIDASPLGVAPFRPAFLDARQLTASSIGLACAGGDALPADLPLLLLPGIAGYVGADITGGLHVGGFAFSDATTLLIDIGTNGEIVLLHNGKLLACATAAGPAFEGSGLRSGTRGTEGAICSVAIRNSPIAFELGTIGGCAPARAMGICGSAYVDFLAEGRKSGLLTPSGRFDAGAWDSLPEELRQVEDGEHSVCLAGEQLAISEVDVAVLLQAKAAIGAGVETLLETAGIAPGDVAEVQLAGGFGMHLNVENAIRIGILPGFRPDQIRVVGNTSLAGAWTALVDASTLPEMEELARRVQVLELNLAEGFEDRYIDNLSLP